MIDKTWQSFWGRLFLVALFGFSIFSNIRIAIQNYHLNQQVQAGEDKVSQMQTNNQKLSLLISYYQSPSYQDVEARYRLGMKRPDETVYTVTGLSDQNAD